ncbi:MAG TPA: 16S rRNA (guanine(966)-N(2))-methyltransferase RsmD [Gaiellaceae bacterium]|nr:16S rRNA (guanine(966)-N(2))-methyltransferase RsmD [Gaiellaceae bacterium]
MRIIAGSRKGHRIAAPRGAGTRPTGDRAREALFAMLGPLDDALVLDLFAGSGALGLEALSRGARRCVFAESDRAAARVIQANVEKLRLTGAVVLARDALAVLREEAVAARRYDLVLCDPPYDQWAAYEDPLGRLLPQVLAPDGVLAVETDARVRPRLPLQPVTSRRYGSARITLFRR